MAGRGHAAQRLGRGDGRDRHQHYDPRAVLPARPHHLAPMLEPRIQQHFFESADLSYQAAEAMARPIADAAQAMVDCVTSGGRIGLGASFGEPAPTARGVRMTRLRQGYGAAGRL
jgi:hypothetical protein